MPLDDSSPHGLRSSPGNLFRLLGCFRRVVLDPRAQLSRSLVIAPVVRGSGGGVGVGGADVKVRCIVGLVLGQSDICVKRTIRRTSERNITWEWA